ncbi:MULTISPECIES: molecular chaperone DnaJ [unclassified Corynebacterium]|uniref:molecular chaperone DnaJ n=1 Tax=Corynebacterium TaxID=1716 RepID=UPI00254C76C3|nr:MULTISPECIES: molecular chaperone DnaJ [unclassified Corynebacterium]MDK8452990.1 molecular chaperone DnaJ [Corynebacterium sp. MSK084]MDK8467492.1 molecular chaperone DnaJ [Corynebacterium sp. MSK130]MDK8514829.1 molecular chaperone DnaJ [Corynebacterium sp. MSK123]MDK8548146.1 molecular chaperone DnaJ [Corynebacterium sp. MSK222]MDK8688099.1 molecular chaperone DnaJ [Corynebacterium sp. MSK122]
MSAKPEWADKDYYADLGVSSSADQSEIKRAYRKLARENHPDTHPDDPAAADRFKRVAEAYDVLSDASERKEYDQFKAMLRNGGGFGRNGGAGFPGGFRSTNMGGQGAQDFDLSDLFGGATGGSSQGGGFGDIFGSVFNRSGSAGHSAKPSRGADVETEITLDFREAAKGTTIPLALSGNAPCTTCHGSGSSSGKTSTCGTCNGSGYTSENRGAFGFSAPCKDCDGTGRRIPDPCPDCNGSGTVHRTRNITVRIPAGVIDGQKVRIAGQGEAGPNGTPAGDLFVAVTVKPDKVFTRDGDDIHITVPVSFAELALGDTITVPTLDSPVRVKIPAGTPDGRTLRVRGRGIAKRAGKAGDLLVSVQVTVPSKLDAAASSALRTYAQAEKDSGFNPRAGWAGAESN